MIGIPVSWYLMGTWLEKYPYKAEVSATLFIAVAIFTLVMAVATVFVKSLRAAMMNPVKSIRNE
jgi:ABC-type antimicrobial peptide transport system permease subunit